MSYYLLKDKEFRYISADETHVHLIYGDHDRKAGILIKTAKKKGWFQEQLMKKYVKDYKKRAFIETDNIFDPDALRIIDVESYQLPKCKYKSYLENQATNRYIEIGVRENEILTREGPIGGLGFQSRNSYPNAIQAENSYFEKPKEWAAKGYKEVLAGAPYPTLKQALLDLEKMADLENKHQQAIAGQSHKRAAESIEEKVFLADYRHYLSQGPYREDFGDWPACLEHLSPAKKKIGSGLPDFIQDAYRRQGIEEEGSMKVPVRITSLLGECPFHQFVSCPNIPEYYYEVQYKDLEDMDDQEIIEKGMRMISAINASSFFWFDGEVTDGKHDSIPLRCVYNTGDPDSNEGFYGAVWHRDSKQLVADILSAGGDKTVIKASAAFSKSYVAHNSVLPLSFDREKYPHNILNNIEYATGHELEKVLHILLLLHRFM